MATFVILCFQRPFQDVYCLRTFLCSISDLADVDIGVFEWIDVDIGVLEWIDVDIGLFEWMMLTLACLGE